MSLLISNFSKVNKAKTSSGGGGFFQIQELAGHTLA